MPDETSKKLIIIETRVDGKDALEQLLAAIKKVEEAVVSMGEKFDQAAQTIATPIKELGASFDKLSMSLERMQRGLGDTTSFDTQRQAAQLLKSDILEADRAIEQFRMKGTQRYREPTGGLFQSRQQMMERYFTGELGPNVWSGIAERGPYVGTPAATQRPTLQYETEKAAAAELGISLEELGARAQKTTADFATQSDVIGRAATIVEMLKSGIITTADAERMLAANIRQTTEATRQLTRADRERWLAMGRMPPGMGKGVSGTYAPPELRKPAMQEVLRQQMGAQPELGEWTRPAGVEKGVPWEPLKRAEYFGQMEVELEQIQKLETAIGRKLVVQKLMERGSRDVAERFEKQFAVTRSKEEILREISRTGKMTTEMEKELGLQTERTGRSAGRAGNMFRYFGRYLLRYLLLWQGIQAVRGISRAWFAAHVEMADAVADFGWRVNATTEDVARYRDKLRDVSMMVGMPVGEIASPLAGRATEADLLRAAEAARVFGGSVEDWVRKLDSGTASLDAYAHGLRISTLATEDYAKLVDNASAIAQEFNMTEEETIGLLSALPSVLQSDAEGAAELTEALAGLYEQNQLLMTLGVAPAVTVGPGGAPQRRPMAEVMAEIGRQPVAQQRQLAVAIGLTSEKQQQFFLDAVAGWAEVTQAIQGTVSATGDMEDALAGAAERLSTHIDALKTSVSGLLETFGTTEWITDWVDAATFAFQGLQRVIEDINQQLGGMGDILAALPLIGPGIATASASARAFAELQRGEKAARRAEALGGRAPTGYAGVTPGTEVPGAAYFPPMPTLRMQEGMGIGQLAAEMERVIDEVFTRPYTTASGEVIQVTKEQIDALRKNTVILDETGEAIGLLNVYAPALAVAQENLKSEMEQQRFNLERLRDITPAQFDVAMRTTLPMWEARLAAIPGFEEERELHTFFVGEQDILRQQLATQTAMAYTLQDILDVEKDQLEGQWNIPSGVTMRVPLTSMDLMRWMRGAGAGTVPTDMMLDQPGGALEAAATAQDNAAIAMQTSSGAQTAAAASMSQLAQQVGAKIYGGVPVEPGIAKEAALEGDVPTGLRQEIHRRPRPIPGAGAALRPPPLGGFPMMQAQFAINLVSQLFLDKKIVTEVVQTELSRQLVNTARGTAGGGASLRP